jgi:predicted enzyme related to lactoylglutathione lyase
VTVVVNRWTAVTVDCLDVDRVAAFWSSLLDRSPGPTEPGWVYLGTPGEAQPRLVFQPVRESKVAKNRLHLDIEVDDIEKGIAQVVALGGSATGQRNEYAEGVVVVMKDVEDNEFCLVTYYDNARS